MGFNKWDRANKHTMSRSPAMDTLRDLSSALWTLRSNQEAARVLRTTNSLLRCFLFFDICYLISGIALITMALTNQLDHRDRMIMFGGLFGVFASVSALVNSLASHGIRTWRRNFLLPWLAFFLGCAGHVDHAHGPLSLLRADPVETCFSLLCQHCCLLLLAPHAQAVYPDGPPQTAGADRGGCRVCDERVPEPRHHHVQPQGPATKV